MMFRISAATRLKENFGSNFTDTRAGKIIPDFQVGGMIRTHDFSLPRTMRRPMRQRQSQVSLGIPIEKNDETF